MIIKVCQFIFAMSLLYSLGKGHGPSFEQTSPKDALCQVWLKLAQWFWRRFFLISSMYFLNYFLFPPLGKRRGPSFEQILIYFTQGYFLQSLVEIGLVVLERLIFKFRWYIFTLLLLSPLEKGCGPSFE